MTSPANPSEYYNLMNFARDNNFISEEQLNTYVESTVEHIDTVATQVFKEAYPLIDNKGLSTVFKIAFFLMVQNKIKERYQIR